MKNSIYDNKEIVEKLAADDKSIIKDAFTDASDWLNAN
jgi:hypothetical protein